MAKEPLALSGGLRVLRTSYGLWSRRDAEPIIGYPPGWVMALYRNRYRHWFKGEYTSNWVWKNFFIWPRILAPLRDKPARILEIGSFEGRSATFFLRYLPRATIVCVDPFEETPEHFLAEWTPQLAKIEQRFDRNVAEFGKRVEKIKSRSAPALASLAAEGRKFDLAYIDGSHRRDDVMTDSLGVWPMIVAGGIVIWDDYEWGPKLPPEERAQPAIDQFLREHEGQYRLLARNYQLAVEKLP
jgi:predicted O-methyltransferase YrrM